MVNVRRPSVTTLTACAVVLAGCSAERTEIVLLVDTDMSVPGSIDEFVVDVTGPDGDARHSAASLADGTLPRSVGLVHTDGPLGPFLVAVSGRHASSPVLERQARVTFFQDQTVLLTILLPYSCRAVTCPRDQTCGNDGTCRSLEIDQDEYVKWRSTTNVADSGTAEDASSDADGGGVGDSATEDGGSDAAAADDGSADDAGAG